MEELLNTSKNKRASINIIFLVLLLFLVCETSEAKEIEFGMHRNSSEDWFVADRESVEIVLKKTPESIEKFINDFSNKKLRNSFLETILPNIKHGRYHQYKTAQQRNTFYQTVSAFIKYHPDVPKRVRNVRFFDITLKINNENTIFIDTEWIGQLTPDAKVHMETVNKILFKKFFDVLHAILFDWKNLKSPLHLLSDETIAKEIISNKRINSLDFDLQMVILEQEIIQNYLNTNKILSKDMEAFNFALSACSNVRVNPLDKDLCDLQRWAAEAGYTSKSFSNKAARIANGRAAIFSLYGKAKDEYISYMSSNKSALGSIAHLEDLIYTVPEHTKDNFFVIVGSFNTKRGALKHREQLLNQFPSVQFVVFPPHIPDAYWTVATASFVSESEALTQAYLCRKSGIAPDAYVLKRSAKTINGKPFYPDPDTIKLPTWSVKPWQRPNIITADKKLLLEIAQYSDINLAEAFLNKLKTRFPDAPLLLFEKEVANERNYSIIIGGFTDEIGINKAKDTARLMGIDLSMVRTIPIPEGPLEGWVLKSTDSVLSNLSNAERVVECYTSGRNTIQTMMDCSGFVVSPRILVQCIQGYNILKNVQDEKFLPSQQECFPSTKEEILRLHHSIDEFLLKEKAALSDIIKISAKDLPIPTEAIEMKSFAEKLFNCKSAANGSEERFQSCILDAGLIGKGMLSDEQSKCLREVKSDQTQLAECILANSRQKDLLNNLECVKNAQGDSLSQAKCFMSEEDRIRTTAAQQCAEASSSTDHFLETCVVESLPPTQRTLASCLINKGKSLEQTLICSANTGDEASQKALRAAECIKKAGDSMKQKQLCIVKELPGVPKALDCVSDTSKSQEEMLVCAFEGKREGLAIAQALACTKSYGDTKKMLIECAAPMLPSEMKEGVTCAAETNGTPEALAGCAAVQFLPENVRGMAKCATSSSSAAGFALCAVGPEMNEDLRIAADCAMSSGGEPITFAVCTGGRLAVHEIMGCMNSKIGESGCFGPCNTLVQAFNKIGNLHKEIGKELIKVTEDVVKTIESVGKAFKVIEKDLADNLEKGRKEICKKIGCDNFPKLPSLPPIKTPTIPFLTTNDEFSNNAFSQEQLSCKAILDIASEAPFFNKVFSGFAIDNTTIPCAIDKTQNKWACDIVLSRKCDGRDMNSGGSAMKDEEIMKLYGNMLNAVSSCLSEWVSRPLETQYVTFEGDYQLTKGFEFWEPNTKSSIVSALAIGKITIHEKETCSESSIKLEIR